jgi:hypothetical protein
MLPATLWLGRTWVEVALLAGTVLLVLIVELLNSGIEAVVDRVSLRPARTVQARQGLRQRGRAAVAAAVRRHLGDAHCGSAWSHDGGPMPRSIPHAVRLLRLAPGADPPTPSGTRRRHGLAGAAGNWSTAAATSA